MNVAMNWEWIVLDPVVSWILRLALASLFATAALHKIRDARGFRQTLSDYEVLPSAMLRPVSISLIALEVLIAIDLATGVVTATLTKLLANLDMGAGSDMIANALPIAGAPTPWAGLAASGLLVIYGGAIAINLLRGRYEIDCGCLGPTARQPLSSWLLVRNGILALGAFLTSLPLSNRGLHAVDGVTMLGGFIVLVLLFSAVNGLAADASRWQTRESLS